MFISKKKTFWYLWVSHSIKWGFQKKNCVYNFTYTGGGCDIDWHDLPFVALFMSMAYVCDSDIDYRTFYDYFVSQIMWV